jgi:hypothetical protein
MCHAIYKKAIHQNLTFFSKQIEQIFRNHVFSWKSFIQQEEQYVEKSWNLLKWKTKLSIHAIDKKTNTSNFYLIKNSFSYFESINHETSQYIWI